MVNRDLENSRKNPKWNQMTPKSQKVEPNDTETILQEKYVSPYVKSLIQQFCYRDSCNEIWKKSVIILKSMYIFPIM